MTKSEMKKLIKPMVKECMQEMLLEEGLLSNLIKEVMKAQPIREIQEQRPVKMDATPFSLAEKARPQGKNSVSKISEARRRLADSIGNGAYGEVFAGLEPAPGGANIPSSSEDTGDPGIDLSMLTNIPGLSGFKTRK
jgi:hypothetical protein